MSEVASRCELVDMTVLVQWDNDNAGTVCLHPMQWQCFQTGQLFPTSKMRMHVE